MTRFQLTLAGLPDARLEDLRAQAGRRAPAPAPPPPAPPVRAAAPPPHAPPTPASAPEGPPPARVAAHRYAKRRGPSRNGAEKKRTLHSLLGDADGGGRTWVPVRNVPAATLSGSRAAAGTLPGEVDGDLPRPGGRGHAVRAGAAPGPGSASCGSPAGGDASPPPTEVRSASPPPASPAGSPAAGRRAGGGPRLPGDGPRDPGAHLRDLLSLRGEARALLRAVEDDVADWGRRLAGAPRGRRLAAEGARRAAGRRQRAAEEQVREAEARVRAAAREASPAAALALVRRVGAVGREVARLRGGVGAAGGPAALVEEGRRADAAGAALRELDADLRRTGMDLCARLESFASAHAALVSDRKRARRAGAAERDAEGAAGELRSRAQELAALVSDA